MKILITAGPTQEPIDSVRYITNASSGKMGYAIASEARVRGHEVCLISGPTSIKLPEGVRVLNVRTAGEMIDETLTELAKGYDVFISAAAIADYTPEKAEASKIKSGQKILLKLKPTRKLTKLVREGFPEMFIVGFKAEYDVSQKELVEAARKKMMEDRLNIVVANDVGKHRFGSDETEVIFLKNSFSSERKKGKKGEIARHLLDLIDDSFSSDKLFY